MIYFKSLRIELLDHTEDEDRNVFPLIIEFLDNPTEELKDKLKPHVFELEEEHENAGKLLNELREITNDFATSSARRLWNISTRLRTFRGIGKRYVRTCSS